MCNLKTLACKCVQKSREADVCLLCGVRNIDLELGFVVGKLTNQAIQV